MNVYITNRDEFIEAITDYVMAEYDIMPRHFDDQPELTGRALMWHKGVLTEFDCSLGRANRLHIHPSYLDSDEEGNPYVLCCTPLEIVALQYLDRAIIGPHRTEIIESLHEWLPSATQLHVRVTLSDPPPVHVHSVLEPSYLIYVLRNIDGVTFRYSYHRIAAKHNPETFHDDDDSSSRSRALYDPLDEYDEYELISESGLTRIMADTPARRSRSSSPGRSRSRSRSPGSSSARRRSRSRSGSRSRSRSRSPGSSSARRRSRSRSSSRTAGRRSGARRSTAGRRRARASRRR